MPQDPTEPSSKEPSSKEPFSSHATDPGGARQSSKSSDEFAHEAASYRRDEASSSFGEERPSADAFATSRFAIEMAKGWVRQHQTAAMVGAFAVGAFVGALMRD